MQPKLRKITHFSGVHRSGKTTAAKRFASENNQIFIPTNFSDITTVKGFDDNPSEEKQVLLMDHMTSLYLRVLRSRSKKYIVFDRSMIDIIAYSLYYDFSREHIEYLWYRFENIYDLLFTNNYIPFHEFFDQPLVNFAKPEEAKKYKRLFEMFDLVKHLFYNYAKKKNYYL